MPPTIIVLSNDTDEEFNWLSSGWYDYKHRGTRKAEQLMKKANAAIDAAADVPDAIDRLKAAGFAIERG